MRPIVTTALLALALVSELRGTACGDEPIVTSSAARPLEGLAVGVEVGEPTSATVRVGLPGGRVGVGAAIGTGIVHGRGLQLHADVTYAFFTLLDDALPVYVGFGGRYYRHDYAPVSVDELPDTHLGLRLSVGAAYRLTTRRVELYAEAAPGYDLYRSDGCSLMSGADSFCPHTMSTHAFLHLAAGARYYF